MLLKRILFILLLVTGAEGKAQQAVIDSLKHEIARVKNDTMKMVLFNVLAENFTELNPDSSLLYAEKAIALASKMKFKLEEIQGLGSKGYALTNMGNYPRSLQTLLAGIAIAHDPETETNVLTDRYPDDDEFASRKTSAHIQRINRLGRIYQHIGILYTNAGNYRKEISYYFKALDNLKPIGNKPLQSIVNGGLGRAYLELKENDSALFYQELAYRQATEVDYRRYQGSILFNLGSAYLAKGDRACSCHLQKVDRCQ